MILPTIKYLTEAHEEQSKVLGIVPYLPCNLRCPFCCTSNGQEIEGALSSEFYRRLLEDNMEQFGLACVLSMGEPLLQPDLFFYMVEPALEAGKPVVLFTNGTKIDKNLAKRLVKSGIGIVGKLYSSSPQLNDQLVGNKHLYSYVTLDGSLHVPKYVVNLLEEGVDKNNFALNTIVVKPNLEEIAAMRQALGEVGIIHFAEFPDVSGRMEDETTRTRYNPSQEERSRIIEELSRVDDYPYKLIKCERHFDIRLLLYRVIGNVIFIGPTGNVIIPKLGVVANGECIGNLKEKHLVDILANAPQIPTKTPP